MDGGLIKGTLLPLLLIAAAAYVGVCALLYLLQDRLIFYPQPLPDSLRRMVEALPDTIELEVHAPDGTRLHGWLRHQSAAPDRGLVIYFGGNAEEVSGHILDAAELAPWSVAAFNYRGYGRSEGDPSEAALVSDALVIYDLLAARSDIDEERIVVLGRSLGSGVAVPLAAHRPVRGLILVSPVRQSEKHRQEDLPLRAGGAAASTPLRLDRARPTDICTDAGARGRAGPNHPSRSLAPTGRRVGRSTPIRAPPGSRPQRHPRRAPLLARNAGIPRVPRPSPVSWEGGLPPDEATAHK